MILAKCVQEVGRHATTKISYCQLGVAIGNHQANLN